MLSGLLGGLSNLGQIYGGYQAQNAINQQNQLNQMRLQALQDQQAATQGAWSDLSGGKLNQFLGSNPLQALQPSQLPTAAPPSTAPPAPLLPTTPQPQRPQQPPQSPYSTAAAGPLGIPGMPAFSPLGVGAGGYPGQSGFGGGGPAPAATAANTEQFGPPQSLAPVSAGGIGAGSPFGPSLPATFGGGGTVAPFLAGLGAQRQAADLTGQQPPSLGLQGPQAGSTVDVGTLSLSPSRQDPRSLGITPPPTESQYTAAAAGGPVGPRSGTMTPPQTASTGDTAALGSTAGGGLFGTILQLESGNNDNIRGPGSYGEIGPAQITPDTWKEYSKPGENINNPQDNRAVGMRVSQDLWGKSGGDAAAVLVGYNRGEGAMRRFQAAGDNLDALRGTRFMPTVAYQRAVLQAGGKSSGGDPVTNAVQTSRALLHQTASPQEIQAGNIGAMSIMQRYPFLANMTGSFDMDGMAKMIEQNHPDASAAVKVGIFQNLFNLLQPIAKERFAETIDLVKTDIAEQQRAETQRETQLFHQAEIAHWGQTEGGGGSVWQPPAGPDGVQPPPVWVSNRGEVRPLTGTGLPAGSTKPSTARQGYQILTDPNTGTQFQQIPGRPETAIDMQGNPYKPTGAAHLGSVGPGQARWSEDAMNSLVQQALSGDPSVMQRLPRSGPARQQFEESLAAHMKDLPGGVEGNTSTMMMNRIRMIEAQSAARTAGRVTMNTELFSQEAQLAGQNLIEVSREVPRTAYRPINELLLAFENNTGDPNVIKLGTAVNAVINAYGKMSNPTGTGIHDADKARISSILDRSLSQGQLEAGVNQIITEGRLVSQAAQKAQEDVIGRITPQAPGVSRPASPAPTTSGGGTATSGGTSQPSAPVTRLITEIPGASPDDPDGTQYQDPTGGVWTKQGNQAVKAQ